MIPKKYRISKKKDISRLRENKKVKFRLNTFIVKQSTSLENKHPRFLVTISKKYSKKAVDRNRLKRRVMSYLYTNRSQFKEFTDYHFICLKKDLVSFQDLVSDLLKIN